MIEAGQIYTGKLGASGRRIKDPPEDLGGCEVDKSVPHGKESNAYLYCQDFGYLAVIWLKSRENGVKKGDMTS